MFTTFNGNVPELIEVISTMPVNSHYLKFCGEKTLPKMIDKMQNGCPLLTAKYAAFPCHTINVATPTYQMANEGLFFDVATFLNGVPECWFNEDFSNDSKAAKDFYINVNFSSNVSNTKIFQKLTKIVQIIDSLEGNGQRLNIFIVAYSANSSAKNQSEFICKVKDQSEPLNLPQMIYLCGSSVMHRYCSLMLRKLKFNDTPYGLPEQDKVQMDKENIFYIPSYYYDTAILNIYDYSNADLLTAYKIK